MRIFGFHFGRDGGARILHRLVEMRLSHLRNVERLPQRDQPCAPHQIFQIGTAEPVSTLGKVLQVDIIGKRHFGGLNAQYPFAARLVGYRHINKLIERELYT